MLFIILIFLFLLALIYNLFIWMENRLLYHPISSIYWQTTEAKDIYLPISIAERIHIQHFELFSDRPVILFCHGNVGNISHRKYMYLLAKTFHLNLILFDYRGFGQSYGYSSKTHLRQDVMSVYTYTRKFYSADKILIWGESLGGYPAVYLASKVSGSNLILVSTFSNLTDVISSPSVKSLLYSLIDVLNNGQLISKVKAKIAIIHSQNDNLIPYQSALKLMSNITSDQKLLITISGAHANPIFCLSDFLLLFNFLNIPIPRPTDQQINDISQEISYVVASEL